METQSAGGYLTYESLLGKRIEADDLRDKLSNIENREEISSAADKNQFHKLSTKEIPGGEVYQWNDCYFISAETSKVDVEAKLRMTLRLISARDPKNIRVFGINYEKYGFEHKIIALKE